MLQDRGELFSLTLVTPTFMRPANAFHTIIPAFIMRDTMPLMSLVSWAAQCSPKATCKF